MDLQSLTIRELHAAVAEARVSAREVAEVFLAEVARAEKSLHAFILPPNAEAILQQAESIDNARQSGEKLGALAGIPIAIKDTFTTRGLTTTAGSRVLEGYKPPYDATVVSKLKAAGALVFGKTNCDEFAMGSSGEHSAYGPTHNPWDKARVPGGSSSGSAVAVAAGECVAALGSDTGGSIRQPAAFCGVVGLKPTYGRVSRHGLIAMASSLDVAGPLARTVEDAAYMLEVIAGFDPHDATTINTPVPPYVAGLTKPIRGMKVGLVREFLGEGIEPGVAETVRAAAKQLQELGAKVVEISLPSAAYALAAYYVLSPAEVSANLARYDGIRFGVREPSRTLLELYNQTRGARLGAEVKRRIMLGAYVLSAGYYDAYYRQAKRVQSYIKADFAKVFESVDVLVGPTSPTVAFPLQSKSHDPLAMYLADINTVPVNIAGLPAVSLPCGFVGGLPVGLQIIGQAWAEADVLRVAYAYEQATSWHKQHPPQT